MVLRILLLLVTCFSLHAAENMMGRQSHNEGIVVVPAPGEVTIDAELDDWDWSGRIWVFADTAVRDRFSVEAAAMWDENYLYLAAKWLDPTPMFSTVDPAFNPNHGWKSDSWQLRIKSDRIGHITTWFFEPKQAPVMHFSYSRGGVGGETFYLMAEDGVDLGRDVQMAYRQTSPKSYTQEMRIPWSLIYQEVPTIGPGLSFSLGNEFLWGDVTGKTWPIHRYADNLQPGQTSREFYWKADKVWGNATLVGQGNVPVRQYVSDDPKLRGTLPIRVSLPAEAVRFTVAINDASGKRIRNLAGDFDPRDYSIAVEDGQRIVELLWDGLDDAGQAVAPGSYTAIGLSHQGLGAEYDMTYYNPGTPPWHTADGSGAWGSNHANPRGVARAGERMIVYWAHSEGGHAIIGLNAAGRKIWGELHGAHALAADAHSVYAVLNERDGQKLYRLAAASGAYKPFVLEQKKRPLFLSVSTILGEQVTGSIVGIASDGKRLAAAINSGSIVILDAESAQVLASIAIEAPVDVAFGNDGSLYALAGNQLHRVDIDAGTTTPIPIPGLGKGVSLAVDNAGNLLVADAGPDSQVKAYTASGQPAYTAGIKGGRPWSGIFEPQAMMMLSSVAVDQHDQIWVVESWSNPRRVSVWGQDGQLIRDYVGNTGYAGTGTWLDERDPSIAYVGPIELKLDRETRSYQVTRVLWAPDASKQEAFPMWTHPHWFSSPHMVYSNVAGGEERRYIYYNGTYSQYHAIYMDDGIMARPVAAVTNAEYLSQALPDLDLGTKKREVMVFWNDLNGDGAVSLDECVVSTVEAQRLMSYWGNRADASLSFYTAGKQMLRISPTSFTAAGAPVYGDAGVQVIELSDRGEYVPLSGTDQVLAISSRGPQRGGRLLAFQKESGAVSWTYPNPYPGVHGSHRASMPEPGLVIGALSICGVAPLAADQGSVFAIRGNLGQDYYLTTDGLYVGALFQDGRLPGDALPVEEAQLVGMPMEGFSEGGEPFSGWFGQQADGNYRMLTSIARTGGMICIIKGLETIERFNPVQLDVDAAMIARAMAENADHAAASEGARSYTIAKLAAPPRIDGDGADWDAVRPLVIERRGSPAKASVKLAYDSDHLYMLFQVDDQSPWLNEGKEANRLFKTGDAVDLQIGPGNQREPRRGDQRVVIAKLGKTPVAVLMRPLDPGAPGELRYVYSSPVSDKVFERVEVLSDARVMVKSGGGAYTVEAAIPLATLGLEPTSGAELRGDLGFISSDAAGTVNVARTYWSNKETNLVNDLPAEAWFNPSAWGTLRWE